MSGVHRLLRDLAEIGASLRPAGGQLLLRAGVKPIPGALVQQIREAKPDLLEILAEKEIIHWLNQHPAPSPAGQCAFCGHHEQPGAVVLPFGTEPGTHAWLHAECWRPWHDQRLARAVSEIARANGQP